MGGNALKHLNPERLNSNQVHNIFWRIEWVANMLGDNVRLVPWTHDKTEHGDVDILLWNHRRAGVLPLADSYFKELGILDYKRNGPVTSIAYPLGGGPIAQVDLIEIDASHYHFTQTYFSGGGLGMLIGRVAASYGFVFGMDGLRLRADPTVPWMKDVMLTQSPYGALKFLGYEPMNGGGFACEREVWEFALSSPKAKPWMFVSDNTNAENRSRDKQRPSFERFQNWLKETYGEKDLVIPFDTKSDAFRSQLFQVAKEAAYDRFMSAGVFDALQNQQHEWEHNKLLASVYGKYAVEVVAPNIVRPDEIGEIISHMQKYLPAKAERKELYESNPKLAGLLATNAAQLAINDIAKENNGQ